MEALSASHGSPASHAAGAAGAVDDGGEELSAAMSSLQFRVSLLQKEVLAMLSSADVKAKQMDKAEQARAYWQAEALRLRRLVLESSTAVTSLVRGSP